MRTTSAIVGLALAACALATPAHAAPSFKSYAVVDSGGFTAPAGQQAHGRAGCPAGTVPLGGGVRILTTSGFVHLSSSFPAGDGWVGVVNNAGSFGALFQVVAICAAPPPGYVLMRAPGAAGRNGQFTVIATCPVGTKLLGGGAIAYSQNLSVTLNGSFPTAANGWRNDLNSTAGVEVLFDSFAICGKRPAGYRFVQGTPVTNHPFSQARTTVPCPGAKVPLSGGALSDSASPLTAMASSAPAGRAWSVTENNNIVDLHTVAANVICVRR